MGLCVFLLGSRFRSAAATLLDDMAPREEGGRLLYDDGVKLREPSSHLICIIVFGVACGQAEYERQEKLNIEQQEKLRLDAM